MEIIRGFKGKLLVLVSCTSSVPSPTPKLTSSTMRLWSMPYHPTISKTIKNAIFAIWKTLISIVLVKAAKRQPTHSVYWTPLKPSRSKQTREEAILKTAGSSLLVQAKTSCSMSTTNWFRKVGYKMRRRRCSTDLTSLMLKNQTVEQSLIIFTTN